MTDHRDMASKTEEALERVNSTVKMGRMHETLFIAVLCMAQLLTQAGLAQTIAPIYIIGASFGTSSSGQLSWFAAAYSLTVGTFILFAGRLGDLFGHKHLFIAGYLWFALWSLLAGISVYTDKIFFDVCRALQGIGPALLLPNSIAILGRTYPPGVKKEMIFSVYGATAPVGFVLGATFTSLFAQQAWWPWAFWTTSILCTALALAAYFIIPKNRSVQTLKTAYFDILGTVTGVSALILINFAWNQGPNAGWGKVYVYVLLIIGAIVLGVFFFVESRASHPLLPIGALSRTSAFVFACISAGWSSFGIWLYYLFMFLETLRRESPLLATAQYVPAAISGPCAALCTGFLLGKCKPSIIMLAAMTAFTVGTILVATVPVEQNYWAQTFVATVVMPWGMDMSFPSANIVLSDSMPREHQGMAASLVNTLINYSISIGLGIAGTIESQVNDGGQDLLKGYRGAWYMGIGLGGLGMCVAATFVVVEFSERKVKEVREGGSEDVV